MTGSDFWGRDFTIDRVLVPAGEVKPLWVKLVVPTDAAAGNWSGTAHVTAGVHTVSVPLSVTVAGPALENGGDDEIERGTRIHWFDSKLAIAGDTVPAPFEPIVVVSPPPPPPPPSNSNGNEDEDNEDKASLTVRMLAKEYTVASTGLPESLLVTADTAAGGKRAIPTTPRQILAAAGMSFEVDGLSLSAPTLSVSAEPSNMSVNWTSHATDSANGVVVSTAGSVDCTGYGLFNITVTAGKSAIAAAGVRLTLPSNPATAFFAMGLGQPGGHIGSWMAADESSQAGLASWLVFDFNRSVSLDGFRLYSSGDGVHDPSKFYLQAASADSAPGAVTWDSIVGHFVGAKGTAAPQEFAFPATTARIWRWVITEVVPTALCSPDLHCQPDVAEVEFREAGSKNFTVNSGTADDSLVISSSSAETAVRTYQKQRHTL